MNRGQNEAKAAAHARRKTPLTWSDLLVIAAAILTLAAVGGAAVGRAKAAPTTQHLVSAQAAQLPDDPGLIRARIRLATGG